MPNNPEFMQAKPIPEDIVHTLRLEGSQGTGIARYPKRLEQRFSSTDIADSLARLALIVEPVDRVLGIDTSRQVAEAFKVGEVIGLRVTAACVDDIDTAFNGIALMPGIDVPDDDDKLHTRQLFAQEIMNIGDEAYAAVEDVFDPLFDDWEQQLVPDVRHQRFLRSGFGIPMAYLLTRYSMDHQEADLQLMAAEAKAAEASDFDWNALLVQ